MPADSNVRRIFKSDALAAILSLASVAAAAPAAAQEAPAAPTETGDIVVTAQRRSESIGKVPLTIQAFSGDLLRASGVTDASALPQVTQGLTFARSGSNTPILTLRGVGFNTPNLSSTSPVGIYTDEVALAYPYMVNGPTFDLERVEVLKGPQGTLYGRNTTGGLINFIAAKPTRQFEGRVASEFGNYDTYNFEGYLSGPVTDTLGIRIAGRSENSDRGWQRSVTRDDRLGKKDRLGLRAVVSWKPVPALSVDLIASYWRDRSDTVAGQAVRLIPNTPGFVQPGVAEAVRADWTTGTADWDPNDGSHDPFKIRSDFYSISGRISYALDPHLTAISLTAYNDLKRHDVNDVDGTAQQVFSYTADGSVQSFSQELRLVGEYDRVNFTVGGYYSRDVIRDNQFGSFEQASVLHFLRFVSQNLVDPGNQLYTAQQYATGFRTFELAQDETSRAASAFANATYHINDRLSVNAGVRYTDDKLTARGCSRDVGGNAVPIWNTAVPAAVFLATGTFPAVTITPNGCLGYNRSYTGPFDPNRPPLAENNVAWRGSLQYDLPGGNLVYGSVSRGYKSGAFPLIPINNEAQDDPARQEHVMAYEVGVKAHPIGRAFQLNMSGFYYDYRNKQLFSEIPDVVFTTLTRIVNIPRSEVYGGELEGSWQSDFGLGLRLGAAYTRSKVLEYAGYDRAGQPLDFRGARFSNTPEWQLTGAVSYDHEMTAALGLRANLNASYQSSTSSSLIGEAGYEIKSYAIVNGTVALYGTARGWEVGAYVRNLFDTYYWTSANYYADTVYRVPGSPRSFGVRLGYHF